MSKARKTAIILLSISGITVSWLLPAGIISVHSAHAYSTYVEFSKLGFINTDRVEEWRKSPGEANYRIDKRMEQIGAVDWYLAVLSLILTAFFLVNAALVMLPLQGLRKAGAKE